MKVKLVISICIISLIACTLFLFLKSTKPTLATQNPQPVIQTSMASSPQETQIEAIFTTASTSPEKAILALKQFIKDEPSYMNQCHEIAHEIGHISYKHFGEQAFTFKDPLCGGGYLHGLLEEATIFDGSMSLTDIVHTVCSGEIEESCLHGLGHAIYKSVQSVPDAISYCNKVRSKNKDCYDGVYMELFDAEEDTTISIADATKICVGADLETKPSCVFYLPRVLKQAPVEDVVAFCSNLTKETNRLVCAQGTGVMFMKYAPVFVLETVISDCALYTKDSLKQACATGANDYYTYGNVTNTEW